MCCLVTTLLLLGPRLALMVWWLMDSARFTLAFHTWPQPLRLAFPLGGLAVGRHHSRAVDDLGVSHRVSGGFVGLDWVWLGLGLLIDLGSHLGSGYRHRDRIRGRRR